MKRIRLTCILGVSVVLVWASIGAAEVLRFDDGGEHTVGGGPSVRIAADLGTTVNILEGTTIELGAEDVSSAALTALHGSHLDVSGGAFTGDVPHAQGANVVKASIEINGGSFTGTIGGLDLFRSDAVINGGTFVSDSASALYASHDSQFEIYGGQFVGGEYSVILGAGDYEIHGGVFSVTDPSQEFVLLLGSEYELDVYGGQFGGMIRMFHGVLTFHGQQLTVSDVDSNIATVSGLNASGEEFSQDIFFSMPLQRILASPTSITLATGIPEPTTGILGALVLILTCGCKTRFHRTAFVADTRSEIQRNA